MINIEELRDRAATFGSDYLTDEEWVAVIDRLVAAESDALEQARLNGMGSERELALMAKLEAAEKHNVKLLAKLVQSEVSRREINEAHKAVTRRLSVLADENTALHVKIAEFEQQEPAAWMHPSGCVLRTLGTGLEKETYTIPLYTLPYTKGEGND